METADGARHAATNVDLRASPAVDPCWVAAVKCPLRSVVAFADRGSLGTSPMTMPTKSPIAASGSALDHCLTLGCCLAMGTSITCPASEMQMFSVAAR